MDKKHRGLIILVIILSLLVVGFGSYFVYDKFLYKSNTHNVDLDNNINNVDLDNNTNDVDLDNNTNESGIPKKTRGWFDYYLEDFTTNSGGSFVRNYDSFTNDDFTIFLYNYYLTRKSIDQDCKQGFYIEEGIIKEVDNADHYLCTIPMETAKKTIYKYFGTENYIPENKTQLQYGYIFKNNELYLSYRPTGIENYSYINEGVVYNNDEIVVTYLVIDGLNPEEYRYDDQLMKIYLKYQNNNFNIIKIEVE